MKCKDNHLCRKYVRGGTDEGVIGQGYSNKELATHTVAAVPVEKLGEIMVVGLVLGNQKKNERDQVQN